MRITGGSLKGRRLIGPPGKTTEIRPLQTRIRKSLFDTLGEDLTGIRVLDLFAGTGALGIEALSRGADFVVFVDKGVKGLEIIQKNLQRFNLLDKARVFRLELPSGLKVLKERVGKTFALIFITPPYKTDLAIRCLESIPEKVCAPEALLVVEVESSVELPKVVKFFTLEDKRVYGETALYFYRLS